MYHGIKDQDFIRSQIPMTKEEIRAIVLRELKLQPSSILLDIGAGTGSISIEAAQITQQGKVWAIEEKPEAVTLIQKNINKFGIKNIKIIQGQAPDCLQNLPGFTHAFIGGSGGRISEILTYLKNQISRPGYIAITAINPDTVSQSYSFLQNQGFQEIKSILVQISRSERAGNSVLYKALNPIYIISANI
ncbi:MAG: precorrin-6Y C5,15-methyltransferase (decarboxylating) subunit CbiT [Spirochaetes bacterium]|nr:precorrin-6Y C5,15-methyltransferase (decarboxylating) subunit CbiT [Spirochaetota bacterium]